MILINKRIISTKNYIIFYYNVNILKKLLARIIFYKFKLIFKKRIFIFLLLELETTQILIVIILKQN